MADIQIFNDEAFSVSSLTAAINEQEYVPGRIGSLGLFQEEGITTLTVQIEKDGDTLALVPAGERGTSGLVVSGSKRNLIPFNTVHLPERFTIKADEIQGIRAFGTRSELQSVQDVVNKRLAKARRQLDVTHEFQRLGALNGKIYDADGKTVLLDLYERFGVQRQRMPMEFANPKVNFRVKCGDALDMQEEALGTVTRSGSRAFCGKNFWNAMLELEEVNKTYLNTQQAASLRGDARESFDYGGITWERYRGKIAGMTFVHDDKALLIPEGVPDLYISVFAPADYMETVNTEGVPYYSKIEPLPFNKGMVGEAQSNPLHMCTRPLAQILLEM
jgi:hypothetical protein